MAAGGAGTDGEGIIEAENNVISGARVFSGRRDHTSEGAVITGTISYIAGVGVVVVVVAVSRLDIGGEIDGGGVAVPEVEHEVDKLLDTRLGGVHEPARVVVLVLEAGDAVANVHVGAYKDLGGGGGLLEALAGLNVGPVGGGVIIGAFTGGHNGVAAECGGGVHLGNGKVAELVLEVKGVGLDASKKVVPGE